VLAIWVCNSWVSLFLISKTSIHSISSNLDSKAIDFKPSFKRSLLVPMMA
jgi:hypothetical protein